jgi:hypothetical protein
MGAREDLLAEAQRELAGMRALRDFVRAFRDGKISLDEFKKGPEGPEVERSQNPYDDDTDDFDDELVALMAELTRGYEPPVRPSRTGRGRRKTRKRR